MHSIQQYTNIVEVYRLQHTYVHPRRQLQYLFFFSSRRRHTRFDCDWSSDVCSSDLLVGHVHDLGAGHELEQLAADVTGRSAEIGRASCRERVWILYVAKSLDNVSEIKSVY